MRILFVTLPSNIHALRWISQFTDQGWDLHLAPVIADGLHPDLVGKVTFHPSGKVIPPSANYPASSAARAKPSRALTPRNMAVALLARWPIARGSGHAHRMMERLQPGSTGRHSGMTSPSMLAPHPSSPAPVTQGSDLAATIDHVQPDIVHAMIAHVGGYETLAARKKTKKPFPPWIVSIWGSDLYFFGQLAKQRAHLQEVMASCDYVTAECERDIGLARQFGFKGQALPVISAAGGYDLARWQKLRQPGPISGRRMILLKGYQHANGRALVGLRALEMCADLLRGYHIYVHLASPDVELAAEVMASRTGLSIETKPLEWHTDYEEVMRRYGRARIHIGLSVADGISQSLLESMMMGAFPIQSCTACADEWLVDGEGGLIVHPEDPHLVAEAIRRAVTEDALVDRAAQINAETVQHRLAYADVKEQVIAMYNTVYANR